MKNKKRIMAVLLGAVFLLSGCGAEENIKNVKDTENSISDHDPITLVAQYKDMSAFIELVHAQYPEINMEIIPYSGANYTAYVDAQLESGEMPDIYCTKVYLPGQKDLSDKLIDLSGYDFLSEYFRIY